MKCKKKRLLFVLFLVVLIEKSTDYVSSKIKATRHPPT